MDQVDSAIALVYKELLPESKEPLLFAIFISTVITAFLAKKEAERQPGFCPEENDDEALRQWWLN